MASCKDGSSPRAWGTFVKLQGQLGVKRFIPTRVGNIHQTTKGMTMNAVHPHARGEHVGVRRLWAEGDGSSPRAWGTYAQHQMAVGADRFIPTRVGNMPV